MTDTLVMSRPKTVAALLVLILSTCVASFSSANVGAETPVASTESFAGSWFLVRLETAIEDTASDGSSSPCTGLPFVDALIPETGVQEIESALPVSTRDPRFPGALARHGLDRTYKFMVPEGSDIPALVERFARAPGVEYAEPDYIGTIGGRLVPDDPRFPNQWGLDQPSDADVDAPEAWEIAVGEGVIIAIVDTGIDSDHEDLVGKILPGHDFANGDPDPEDDYFHGTVVSSIASAQTDNGLGIAGVCWNCLLLPVKAWDENGQAPQSWSADGIVWAVDNGARIINFSGGYNIGGSTLLSAVQYAYDAGVVHVSITSNSNVQSVTYPGRSPLTIAVGATNSDDERAVPFCLNSSPGSNYGPRIDVVAPGDEIDAATIGGYGFPWCGTSFAAPFVSGLVGIMETIYPSVGREEVKHLIHSGAEDQVSNRMIEGTTELEDAPGFDIYHGWGRVNMHRTLEATQASITLRVDGKSATRLFYDTANPWADSYDFVRGDLDVLNESVAGVDVGTVVCLEDDSIDPDTVGDEDLATPETGEGFFYLGRFNAAPGHGWYGGSSVNRDRLPASGNCPGCGNDIIEGTEVCDGSDLAGETCASQGFDTGTLTCNQSCDDFDTSACAICGNNVCEILGGEDCLSCSADCNGVQSGNPGNQFCCGDGAGSNPATCEDARCTGDGNTCAS